MKTIKSEHHVLSVDEVNEIALSLLDNKRFYAEDGIHSLAYGHYKTALKKIFPKEHESADDLQFEDTSVCSCDDFSGSEASSSDNESYVNFVPPDPGLWQTASINSDEDYIVDGENLVRRNNIITIHI